LIFSYLMRMKRLLRIIAAFVILLFLIIQSVLAQDTLKIINARILDGTGNSWYWGEITASNGKIVSIKKTAGLRLKGEANLQPTTHNPQLITHN
jgi:hypothetical protein